MLFCNDYDSVRKEVLYNILIEVDVSTKQVRIIKMCLHKTYNNVQTAKYLFDELPIHMCLKQGGGLEYAIIKAQED